MEYLEENYGVQIDHDKYNVFYDGFASNIMPEITVILADKGIGHKRSFYHASVSCIRFMRPFFCSYGKQGV